MGGEKEKATKKGKKKQPEPETALELVGKELGISVPNMRTGNFSDLSLQEIAWRPRAALFISNYGEKVLENIIVSEEEQTKDRIKALELLMAYTYGKPAQKVEHTGPGGGPIQVMAGRLSGMKIEDIQTILDFKPGQNVQDDYYNYPQNFDEDEDEAEIIDVEPISFESQSEDDYEQ